MISIELVDKLKHELKQITNIHPIPNAADSPPGSKTLSMLCWSDKHNRYYIVNVSYLRIHAANDEMMVDLCKNAIQEAETELDKGETA